MDGQMDERNAAYTCNGMLLGLKRSEALVHATTQMNVKNVTPREKRHTLKGPRATRPR